MLIINCDKGATFNLYAFLNLCKIRKGKFMSLLNNVAKFTERPAKSGWHSLGVDKKPADTRTTKQLLENIDYFANKNPEVAKFKNELKSVQPKFLNLVSDICELANGKEMLPVNIDLRKAENGKKSVLGYVMENFSKTSKENPHMLEFTQEVLNNTDATASKYFLTDYAGMMGCNSAGKHFEAAKPLVKDIAEATLSGGLRMDFAKEKSFMNYVKSIISPDVEPERIKLLQKASKAADDTVGENSFYVDNFVRSETPIPQIEANIPQLKQASIDAKKQGKSLDITEFLTTHLNYAKAPQRVDINAVKSGNIKLV